MANDKSYEKKSYVMYKSWSHMILAISDEQAGILIKAICNYQLGQQVQIDDSLLGGIFEMFKASFEQDDSKYKDRCEKNALNGSKGGKAKALNSSKRKQTLANANEEKQSLANLADMDTDMDIDMDTDIDMDKEKETDTDTGTDKGVSASSASVSASASSFSSVPAAIPKTEEELIEICKKEHIQCNGNDIEYYFYEMQRNDWKDGSGNPIRCVAAHFRDWLKRNADTTVDYCVEQTVYDWIIKTLHPTMRQDMVDTLVANDIFLCVGEGDAKNHTAIDFIELLEDNGINGAAQELSTKLKELYPSGIDENGWTVY